jgi:raffinose/stachyose/melibiose transport system substrate-binding protein
MPQDWPGLLAALQSVRAHGGNGMMVANKAGWGGEQLALGLAANLVRPGWAEDVNRGRASFSSDWGPVVDRLRELVGSGAVDGKLMLGLDPWSQALDEFKAGKWAFLVQGAWELADFAKAVKFPFTLEPFPGGPAGSRPHSFTFVGTGLGVNSAAEHADLAKEYVRFMARPDIEQRYLEAEGAFSPVPAIASTAPAQAKPLLDAFTEGRTVNSPAEVIDFTGMEPALCSALQKVFLDPAVPTADVLSGVDEAIRTNR